MIKYDALHYEIIRVMGGEMCLFYIVDCYIVDNFFLL